MGVVISGFDLSEADVVAVARGRVRVELGDGVSDRLEAACQTMDHALASGIPVYCVSVGAGASKDSSVDPVARQRFEHLLLRNSMVGQGPPAALDTVRGTLLVVVNLLAAGRSASRIETVQRLVDALNGDDRLPGVPLLGSIGQADLAPLSHLDARHPRRRAAARRRSGRPDQHERVLERTVGTRASRCARGCWPRSRRRPDWHSRASAPTPRRCTVPSTTCGPFPA